MIVPRRRLVMATFIAALATGLAVAAPPLRAEANVGVGVPAPADVVTRYGVGVRMPRWVSVPGWLLDLFTEENEPLSTFKSFGVEFFGRRDNYDIVVGLTYQNMSPPDGNWLGKNRDATFDTDLVQMRSLALLGLDASIFYRQPFTRNVGAHWGAGLGLAKVLGQVLRTSNANCTAANAGNERACRPRFCPPQGCTEEMLKASESGTDGGPDFPARFQDPDIPGAFPILHINVGLDFRLPEEAPGLEARLETGFYDGFFAGMSLAYVF
jgi:hypothetical protein